jgi:hypothetical protein
MPYLEDFASKPTKVPQKNQSINRQNPKARPIGKQNDQTGQKPARY